MNLYRMALPLLQKGLPSIRLLIFIPSMRFDFRYSLPAVTVAAARQGAWACNLHEISRFKGAPNHGMRTIQSLVLQGLPAPLFMRLHVVV